jgi:DNA-directed RNA polymerase specialized sigma24 family protein
MASRGENEGFQILEELVSDALPEQTDPAPKRYGNATNEGMIVLEEVIADQETPTPAPAPALTIVLPEGLREVFQLRIDGLPTAEIAARLRLPTATVTERLAQIRESLRELQQRLEDAPS